VKLGLESSRSSTYLADIEPEPAPISEIRVKPTPREEPERLPSEDRLAALAAEALRLEIEAGCLRERSARVVSA